MHSLTQSNALRNIPIDAVQTVSRVLNMGPQRYIVCFTAGKVIRLEY